MIDVLAIALLALPPLDWMAAILLMQSSRRNPEVISLRERAVNAFILAAAATGVGAMAWARLGVFEIPPGAGLVILGLVLVGLSFPALYWLFLLFTGRFGRA